MRRSLLYRNKLAGALLAMVSLAGCTDSGGSGDETVSEDSVSYMVTETIAPGAAVDSPVKQQPTVSSTDGKTPEEKKEGQAIKHQSENDRLLDSIKKAKDKTTTNRNIQHGSENDRLLDSIKQAKAKGKH